MDVITTAPPRARWRYVPIGLATALLLAVSIYALPRLSSSRASVNSETLWIGTAQTAPMTIDVEATGRLVPEVERWITAPSEGTIESVEVRAGDELRAGQLVMKIRNDDLERRFVEAELDARTELVDQATLANRLRNEILDLQASIALLESQLGQAELKLEAGERLVRDGLLASIEQESERFVVQGLSKRLQIERERLERRQESMATEIEAQSLRVQRAQAAAGNARRDIERLSVRTERGGIAGEILASDGTSVTRGQKLARIIDPSRLRAELDVPQVQARLVRLGQDVRIDTRNTVVRGQVSRIDPAVQNGSVLVDVTLLDELPDDARSELRVDGSIEIDSLGPTLQIRRPLRAREDSEIDLFRIDDDGQVATRVRVRLGRLSSSTAQVLSGLDEGERVILSDTSSFATEDQIQID